MMETDQKVLCPIGPPAVIPHAVRRGLVVKQAKQIGGSMAKHVLIADYHEGRRQQLRKLIESSLKGYNVWELPTESPSPKRETNARILGEISQRKYDLMIGHTGGNPSGAECLHAFKEHNPQGRVILYTKRDEIPLKELQDLKRANKLIRRSDDDEILFNDPLSMMNTIKEVMDEPGLVFWKNPFAHASVVTSLVGLATAVVGLAAALLKLVGEN